MKVSKLLQQQMGKPSPIREIMKMAQPENIAKMGLDPEQVISFAGGWVAHEAPEELRKEYTRICTNKKIFHRAGAYSTTIGSLKLRELLGKVEAQLWAVELKPENILIGMSSTQLTYDLLVTLVNPGESVLLLDPTYANYWGQIALALPEVKVHTIQALNTDEWLYRGGEELVESFQQLYARAEPKLILFPSPDNPTSQIIPQEFVDTLLESTKSFVVIDFAYKTQFFDAPPKYFSYSPLDYPNLICIHSNSKWCRGLGRRLGWIEAGEDIIKGMERLSQCTILCPDTLHQLALRNYFESALEDGSLKKYVESVRRKYKKAAAVTIKAIDKELGMRRLVPQGGLYTVMDVGRDGDEWVREVMKSTGVLFVPGRGFGKSLVNAVRASYGPWVNAVEKIKEGMERVGKYLAE